MEGQNSSVMMGFHVPEDPEILKILGEITLRHSHLEYILRMTVKTLSGVSVQQALDATAFESSTALRKRIYKLAKQKLSEGSALIQLQALLERCRRATEQRNDFVHSIWACELDGDPKMRTRDHKWKPIPNIDELTVLTAELLSLVKELNDARFDGFLSEAIALRNKSETV